MSCEVHWVWEHKLLKFKYPKKETTHRYAMCNADSHIHTTMLIAQGYSLAWHVLHIQIYWPSSTPPDDHIVTENSPSNVLIWTCFCCHFCPELLYSPQVILLISCVIFIVTLDVFYGFSVIMCFLYVIFPSYEVVFNFVTYKWHLFGKIFY